MALTPTELLSHLSQASWKSMAHKGERGRPLTQVRSAAARVAWSVILVNPDSHPDAPGTREKRQDG